MSWTKLLRLPTQKTTTRTMALRILLAVLINLGTIAVSVAISDGQTVSAPGLPQAIPNPGQITANLNYPTAGTIATMELFFQFTHPCERNLTMDLVAPDSHTVRVFAGGANGCSGIANPSSSDNTVVGQPQFFGGHQAQGIWKLIVTNTPGYSGTLDAFRLTITVQAPTFASGGAPSQMNPFGSAAEPINTAIGNYYTSHSDLAVPGTGLSFG